MAHLSVLCEHWRLTAHGLLLYMLRTDLQSLVYACNRMKHVFWQNEPSSKRYFLFGVGWSVSSAPGWRFRILRKTDSISPRQDQVTRDPTMPAENRVVLFHVGTVACWTSCNASDRRATSGRQLSHSDIYTEWFASVFNKSRIEERLTPGFLVRC